MVSACRPGAPNSQTPTAGTEGDVDESYSKEGCPSFGKREPAEITCPTDTSCSFDDYDFGPGYADSDPKEYASPEVIQKTIRAHYGGVRSCYEAALARDRCLAGKIAIRFVIEKDGTVACMGSADTSDRLNDCELERCVHEQLRNITFPASPDIIKVVYPLAFAPGE